MTQSSRRIPTYLRKMYQIFKVEVCRVRNRMGYMVRLQGSWWLIPTGGEEWGTILAKMNDEQKTARFKATVHFSLQPSSVYSFLPVDLWRTFLQPVCYYPTDFSPLHKHLSWRWRQDVPAKCPYSLAIPHDATIQKTTIWRTSKTMFSSVVTSSYRCLMPFGSTLRCFGFVWIEERSLVRLIFYLESAMPD
jgi:hypothetical protein